MADLRGEAAVVGVAESDLGQVEPGVTALDLAAQAATRALDDAGLTTRDVDGIFSVVNGKLLHTVDVGEYLGVRPRFTDSTMIGGSAFVSMLHHAALALSAGACDVALITYGSTARSDAKAGRLYGGRPPDQPDYESEFRPRSPVSGYALAARRHMYEYGTTREQLAEVAVAARQWAALNPRAFRRDPITVADVVDSPVVSSPFGALDCCLVTDGGGAAVVVRGDRATESPKPPAYVLGAAEAHWHKWISQMPDLTVTAATESGERAFRMARLGQGDVDVLQLYDAFTINPILFLEDLGFCAKGEGGEFVSGGRIAPGGSLPVNTTGGGLSYCHPGMYGIFTIIESVRQLRGEAGDRQVAGAEVALAHGNGGQLSSQATAILGTESTL
jgi:acetyl-CoA acetyltransferase